MSPKGRKVPKVASGIPQYQPRPTTAAGIPPITREPRKLNIDHDDISKRRPVWRFEELDTAWPPAAVALTTAQFMMLHAKLGAYESQTLHEIWSLLDNGCKGYEVENLPNPAAKRLLEMEKDDATLLHSLRLNGAYRVWGILRENVYYVLWLDPEHEVWPSHLKHT